MKSPAILGSAALLAIAQPCHPASAADCRPLQVLDTIKLEAIDRGNARLVPVTIDGSARQLLLDTGGYVSHLSAAAVADLHLPLQDSNLRTMDVTGNQSLHRVQTKEFVLGKTHSSGVQFQVAPNPGMGSQGAPFDGVLAGDQLLANDAEIDFGTDTLTFLSTDHCPGAPAARGSLAMIEVPLRIENGSYIVTTVELDGHKLTALIDTGATASAMGMITAEHPFGIEPGGPDDIPVRSLNGGTIAGAWRHKFSTLSFGGLTIKDPSVIMMGAQQMQGELPAVAGAESPLDRWDMLLGMDLLKYLRLYIAPKEGKLYVAPVSASVVTPQ